MNNFLIDSFALSEDFVNVFLIGKVRSAHSGDCILSGASLPGSRAEVVILSRPSITASSFHYRKNFRIQLTFLKG